MKKVLLYGWYNADNLGDDFMLETTYEFLENKGIEVSIFEREGEKNYFEMHKKYNKIDFFLYHKIKSNRFINKFIKLFKMLSFNFTNKDCKSLQEFDSIIFIGGGYINSVFSFKEIINIYLLNRKFRKLGKSIFYTGQTVGPFKNIIIQKIAQNLYKNATKIVVREKYSYELLNNLSIKNKLVGDDAYLYKKQYSNTSMGNYMIVNVKDFKGYEGIKKTYFGMIQNIAKELHYSVICIPFRSDKQSKEYENNLELCENLIQNNIDAQLIIPKSIEELEQLYVNSNFTIGSAYHSIVLSLLFCKEAYSVYVGKYYEIKIKGILGMYGLEETNCIDITKDDTKKFIQYIIEKQKFCDKNYNIITNRTHEIIENVTNEWNQIIQM